MAEEEDEQGQLLGRQVQGMAGPLGLLRRQVHTHVAIGERHDLDRPPATDQGAGAGQQLLEGERLAQVVVGTAVEAAHPVADRVARREEEHGRGPALAAMALQDRQAVRAGQPPVEDDEVPVAGPPRLPAASPSAACATVKPSSDSPSTIDRARLASSSTSKIRFSMIPPRLPLPIAAGMHRTPILRLQHSRPIGGRRVRQMKRISCAGPTVRPGRARARGWAARGATMKRILDLMQPRGASCASHPAAAR